MDKSTNTEHWDGIYTTKDFQNVSWYQETPSESLSWIAKFQLRHDAVMIDIGAGESYLVDHLLRDGYKNMTVLDISSSAIHKAQQRLGDRASKVHWVISDMLEFKPIQQYDLWHDRAAFHFLTQPEDIQKYVATAAAAIKPQGILLLGTFSNNGPLKCSGLEIKQYSENTMLQQFETYFEKMECHTIDHTTPWGSIQNFLFCAMRRR